MKRTLDIFVAGLGLALLAIPMGLIALAIYGEDRRSPFYRGCRIARGGGEFRMLKFRTMRVDAWKTGVNSTAAGDPRITRVGQLLRATKLDELPQLWNVLKGEMSLVGPRPQVPADASLYTREERRMLSVRPGMTDLASIVFSDEGQILAGADDPDLLYNQIIRPWKSRLALAYLDHASRMVDVRILGITILAAVSRRRALRAVGRLIESWNLDPLLRRMAARNEPLIAWPPPGSHEIASEYPRAAGASR